VGSLSDKLYQGIINEYKELIDRTIGVVDDTSAIIACSELSKIGEIIDIITFETLANTSPFIIDGCTYLAFGNGVRNEAAVFVQGTDEYAQRQVQMLGIAFGNVKQYYDEKYDKGNFIKNVVLDNILPGDIYLKARELRLNSEVTRVCMLIKLTSKTEVSVLDIVQNLFPDKSKDYVFNVNETDIALVKEIRPNTESSDLEKLASSIADTLSSEFYTHCVIGIGSAVTGIKDLAHSFKEALVTIEVSKVFDNEHNVVSYDNLGIARLVYQLPTNLCEMFLREVFNRGSIENLDSETLFTIQKFFENNLNVSETSRRLFVHRNTLVYRLEKIKKLTGLDLREFEDAIVFKVALMVKKYLTARPTKF
jgi:carbohydrate diacid regulator